MAMIIDGTNGVTFPNSTVQAVAVVAQSVYRLKLLLSGTTYTKPSDVKSLYAFVYGATGGVTSNAGGGGPGYSETYYASPASSYSYAIGAAGVMATPTAGGTTSFGAMSVTSSAAVSTNTGGLGGVGSGGDFNANGGAGGNTTSNTAGSGGAGSRAGNGGNGGTASTGFGGGGGTGGNAGTNSPTTQSQGAAATAKAAGALTLPWATAGEYFDGGNGTTVGSGIVGAYAITGFITDTVSQISRAFASAGGATLFALGAQVGGTVNGLGIPPSKGLIILVEVL